MSRESWYYLRASEALNILSPLDKEEIIEFLSETTHEFLQTPEIEDMSEEQYSSITRNLVIPVSIPQVHIVHNVELMLPPEDHFVVGKSIQATLSISTLQTWAPPGEEADYINGTIRFIYDLIVSENWAFSGKKKSFFHVNKNTQEFHLTLIPLRTGKLLFPRVDIQFQGHSNSKSQFSMEINYRNEYQFAVVVPEFKDRLTLTF